MTFPIEDQVVANLLADVPAIANASRVYVSKLPGGLSNTNYLVDADGEKFVARRGCDNAQAIGIDRQREEVAVRRAHDAGIAPEIVAFTQPEGHAVFRFIPDAATPTIEEFTDPDMVARVGRRMRDVHSLAPIGGIFDPFAVIGRWREVLDVRRQHPPKRLGKLLSLVEAADLYRIGSDRIELVVCHNDPYHLNFLDDGNLWLIDWEYAGMGDAMYDLSGIGLNLDRTGRDILLESHFGSVHDDHRTRLDALIPVFLAWNTMWCLVQVGSGAVDHDYFGMAEDYLDMA